jgi:hypothetical protein
MLNPFEKLSVMINKGLFGESNPLCYTAYKAHGFWYVLFNCCFFWERNHCRKVYLMKRVHNANRK